MCYTDLLHKSYGSLGQIFCLISTFLSNRRLRVVLDGKYSQEYPVNAKIPQFSIVGPTRFYIELYINGFPDDTTVIILLSMLMILLFTLSAIRYLICGNNCNWLLNLNLICETLWTGASCAEKTQLVLINQSNN